MDFFCSWSSYKAGLGSQESEFWLGNENLPQLTLQSRFSVGSRELEGHFPDILTSHLGSEDSSISASLSPRYLGAAGGAGGL